MLGELIPVSPAVTTAAATAAKTTTVAAAEAAGAFRARPGFVHGEFTIADLGFVHFFNSDFRFILTAHFDEPESARAAGFHVRNQLGADDLSMGREQLVELVF